MTEAVSPDLTDPKRSWLDTARDFLQPKMLMMVVLGLAAGTPFLLYFSALSYWLAKSGTNTEIISFFLWFGLAYSFKFLWAPILDRFNAPGFGALLGKRRGWILTAQIGLIIALIGQGATDPATNLWMTALFSLLTAFMSATQDIGIDAWRIEIAKNEDEQAPLASAYQIGYRVGLIAAGGGALFIAGVSSWMFAYWTMAAIIVICAITLFFIPEPSGERAHIEGGSLPEKIRHGITGLGFILAVTAGLAAFAIGIGLVVPEILSALGVEVTRGFIRSLVLYIVTAPFLLAALFLPRIRKLPQSSDWLTHPFLGAVTSFFWRFGWAALMLLLFISLYRMSDFVMGVMAKPLYQSLGYGETAVGLYSGTLGPWITAAGAVAGGLIALRFGMVRALVIGAIISVLGNAVFIWLAASTGAEVWRLAAAIVADNLAGGFAGTVFIAYLSGLTLKTFTATQYALFSSMYALGPKLLAGLSGGVVEQFGYIWFFTFAAVLGLPAIILSFFVPNIKPDRELT